MLSAVIISMLLAQEPAAPPAPPPVTAPPLLPAPEGDPRPPPAVMPKLSNQPLGVDDDDGPGAQRVAAPADEPPGRMKRVGLSLAFGAISGAAFGAACGLITLAIGARSQAYPMGNAWTGAAVGFVAGVPAGVALAGLLFEGNGKWWAAILGDLAGALIGLGAVAFGGPDGGAALFTLPLAGAVLAYELTSDANRSATVTPAVSVFKNGQGGSFGLMGQW